MDILDAALELVATGVTAMIYGTEDRPRHVIWRMLLRVFVFGGACVSTLYLAPVFGSFAVPYWLVALWLFALVVLMWGESELGVYWLAYLALAWGGILLALAILL